VAGAQDGQRVVAVVLGAAAVLGHPMGRQDARLLALPAQLARPGLRARARFHQNAQARRQAAQERGKRLA
jgi:hypothetical protein